MITDPIRTQSWQFDKDNQTLPEHRNKTGAAGGKCKHCVKNDSKYIFI